MKKVMGFVLAGLVVMAGSAMAGEKAPQKPWDGADTLEWTHLPTPAPYHSFETPPTVK